MSIETDAQKDLALNPEDAENVVGGKKSKKKAHKKQAVRHASAGPSINIQTQPTVTEYSTTMTDEGDMGGDAGAAVASDSTESAG